MAKKKRPATPATARPVDEYRHKTATGPRVPEAGAQPYVKGQPPAAKYRYDSSLAPALEWDERNPAREEAEALMRTRVGSPGSSRAPTAAWTPGVRVGEAAGVSASRVGEGAAGGSGA